MDIARPCPCALWETKTDQRTEFVYLIRWPDTETMRQGWVKLMADQEWSAIKEKSAAEHGAAVGAAPVLIGIGSTGPFLDRCTS